MSCCPECGGSGKAWSTTDFLVTGEEGWPTTCTECLGGAYVPASIEDTKGALMIQTFRNPRLPGFTFIWRGGEKALDIFYRGRLHEHKVHLSTLGLVPPTFADAEKAVEDWVAIKAPELALKGIA